MRVSHSGDIGETIQVRVYSVRAPIYGDPPKWTTRKPEKKRDILDDFFVTLYTDRDEVVNDEMARQKVEKWIGIKGLECVPVSQILYVLRNEFR